MSASWGAGVAAPRAGGPGLRPTGRRYVTLAALLLLLGSGAPGTASPRIRDYVEVGTVCGPRPALSYRAWWNPERSGELVVVLTLRNRSRCPMKFAGVTLRPRGYYLRVEAPAVAYDWAFCDTPCGVQTDWSRTHSHREAGIARYSICTGPQWVAAGDIGRWGAVRITVRVDVMPETML